MQTDFLHARLNLSMNPTRGFDGQRPGDIIKPDARPVQKVSESFPPAKPATVESSKPAFHVQPGSEVYVRRSSGEIEGEWVSGPEDPQTGTVKITKADGSGNTLVKNINRQELDELNRPTTLKDIRGIGQQGMDSLVCAVRRLQEGGITDADGFVSSEDEVRMIISAYNGELPLNKITGAGYLKQVLEHLMRIRQIRGELRRGEETVEPFQAEEDRSVVLPTRKATGQIEGQSVRKMPEQGEWVTVQREDGQFEGNWVMMQPDAKTGTVMLLQIVNNLPWTEKTVSLDELREWNS